MRGGVRTQAACDASVVRGAFADKLPPRNVEHEATQAWLAVDQLTTAEPKQLRENILALVEMREKLDAMFEAVSS